MKILYVLGAVQHPSIVRGALRHYHFLRILARRHECTLLVLADREVPGEALDELEDVAERVIVFRPETVFDDARSEAGRTPLGRVRRKVELRRTAHRMGRVLRELARSGEHDVVLFHGKRIYPAIAGFRELPVVVDFCDATSLRHRERLRHTSLGALPWRAGAYLAARRTEAGLLGGTPHVAFISNRDRAAVVGTGEGGRIVPNGIDLEYWSPRAEWDRTDGACRLVFTGVMDYAPNEAACFALLRDVFPRVRDVHPDGRLVLAGRSPTPALVEAVGRSEGAEATGFVEDLRPYLGSAHLFAAPIPYASGTQNKVLEAMALGVPVLTTPVVAEGLRVEGGAPPPVAVAAPGEAFSRETLRLLADPARRRAMAREGRRFVETHFDWARSATLLEDLCAEAVAGGGRLVRATEASR